MGRLLYIDALRGFAILLVVMGHLIQYNAQEWYHHPIFNVIYSFHMPLFFFISGMAQHLSEKKVPLTEIRSAGVYLWRRIQSLTVPFLAWTIVVPLFFSSLSGVHVNFGQYWFLNALLAVSVLHAVSCMLVEWRYGKWFVIVIYVAVLAGMAVTHKYIFFFAIIFEIGYLFQKHDLITRLPEWQFSAMGVAFLLLMGLYQFGEGHMDTSNIWISSIISITGSFALVYVFRKIEENASMEMRRLALVGKFTLGIYVCHYYFIHHLPIDWLFKMNNVMAQGVVLLLLAIVVTICCIGIQKMAEPLKYVNGLLYGKWK